MPVNKRHDRNSAFGRLYKRLGGNEKIIKALRLLTLEYKVIFCGGLTPVDAFLHHAAFLQ